MLWFKGSIPEAIARTKEREAVFVVFVAGDDEQSTQMAESWENEKVTETAAKGFVAIKIDSKSEACLQFSQIYPVVCIPSSFFIGDNGVPLEVIAGSMSTDELVNRIDKVKQMHTVKSDVSTDLENHTASSVSECSPASGGLVGSITQSNNGVLIEEHNETDPAPPDISNISSTTLNSLQLNPCEETACGSTTISTADQRSEDEISEKVERITKKLEERREQKQKAEEQNEIKKELERRKTGKDVLEFKRRHEEDLAKRMLEERTKEKAEEKAARERIRQQIALDRADRAARFAKTKEEIEAVKAAALQARQEEIESKRESVQRNRSAVARIQFRLPDGSFFTNQFPSDSPLEEAWQFAAERVGNTYGNFSLATMFPRREFTRDDYGNTLLELDLAPSASVVLLPAGRPSTAVVQSPGGGIWTFFGTILYPLMAVWTFLSNFLLGSAPPTQAATRSTYEQERSNPSTSNRTEPKREAVRKRVLEKRNDEFKKEGKVYRLKTQDDDDENNTWNGNSTQQM
ncbi:UBX domain-containing protein 4 isoform X2 [Ambystoma mexicanum]|uniref:UBX domain-containing protein 4 isoform X2 n=1 Tax=Ambystoma mexicanum TaxID=8296 RepID=UPI0037E933FC